MYKENIWLHKAR